MLRIVGGRARRRLVSTAAPSMDNEGLFSSLPDTTAVLADQSTTIIPLLAGHLHSALHAVEASTGAPLYVGIALSCIAVRTLTIPLLIAQQRQGALLRRAAPSLALLRHLFVKDKETPMQEKLVTYRLASRALKRRTGYSALKAWPYVFVQAPAFITLVLSLRHVLATDPAMTEGGALFFVDLASKDPTFALPAVAIGLTYLTIDSALSRQKSPDGIMYRVLSWYQTLLILSFPLMTQIPAGVFMYWIPSSLWSLAQINTLRQTRVRAWLGYDNASADAVSNTTPDTLHVVNAAAAVPDDRILKS